MFLVKTTRTLSAVMLIVSLYAVELTVGSLQAHAQTDASPRLTLSQAIDLAIVQNRNIKLARLAVTDTEHKKEIARSAYFAHISNESKFLHVTELAGVRIPPGAFGEPDATKDLFIGQGASTSYTSGTGLVQPLTQMFKIHESNRAAITDINSAKIQVNETENEIALKVRQLYYGLLIARLRLQAATEEVNTSQVKAQESADAVAQGRALNVAALESRAAVLDAKQAVLTQTFQIHDLTLAFDDLLGLPLSARPELDTDTSAAAIAIPTRDECTRIAEEQSTEIRMAKQAVIKAKAGLAAAKDAYIPDVTGLARYSYQSGVPLLVHNFGSFGFTFTYDLFDGGRRVAEVKDSRTLLSEAELNLAKIEDEVTVQVETTYDKVEELKSMVGVAEEAFGVRVEAARLTDRQFEQNSTLASAREAAHAKATSAKASLLEATLGLSLAEGEVKRAIGQTPR
jgi:outer membrane protein TolC